MAVATITVAENRVVVTPFGSDALIPIVALASSQKDLAAAYATTAGIYADMTAADRAAIGDIITPVARYDTKADADAALAGLSDGDWIEVLVDEDQDDQRTIYKVVSTALVFKTVAGRAISTQAEAEAGAINTRDMSPQAVAQAVRPPTRAEAILRAFPATWKTLKLSGYSTHGVGACTVVRTSLADITAGGYPAASYFRSLDRYMPDGSTDATNGGYWLIREPVHEPEHYGAIGNGNDDTAALLAWASSPLSTHKRLRGSYITFAEIEFNIDDHVEGIGPTSIIDGSGITSTTGVGGTVKMSGETGLVQIADLAADPVKGDIAIQLTDASTLAIGDWICLYNPTDNSWLPAPFPAIYHAGEWCRVQSVDTGTDIVTLYEPLWHGYTAASIDVYRLRSGSPSLKDFTIISPPLERPGLFVDCAINPKIERVWSRGSEYACIRVQRSHDPIFDLSIFGAPETGTPANEYGLVLCSVTGGSISGTYYAQRHGISFTADDFVCMVPNRKTKILADTGASRNLSLDAGGHGCSEGLVVMGGTHGGLSTGGANMRYIGATFRVGKMADGAASIEPIVYSEGWGGDFIFDSCVIETTETISTGALIKLSLQAGHGAKPRFHFNNCIFKDAGGNAYAIRAYHLGLDKEVSIYVNGGRVDLASYSSIVRIQRTSGVSTVDAVVIRDVNGLATNATLISNGSSGTLTVTKQVANPGITQSGTATVTLAAATSGSVAVTFPTPYAAAPTFVPSVQDAVGNWSVAYSGLSGSGVTIKIIETGGVSRTGSVTVGWIAMPASQVAV